MEFKLKKKMKIRTYMAIISATLIAAIVLFLAVYEIIFLKDISATVTQLTKTYDQAVATSMFQRFGDDLNTRNYKKISQSINYSIRNNLIAYFIVKNNNTNKIEYSSIPELSNKDFNIKEIKAISIKSSTNYQVPSNKIYYISGVKKDKTMYIGFYYQSPISQSIDLFTNNMSYIVFLCIVLGLLLSHVFMKIITTPLNKLSDASRLFAKGDFNHRIPYFNYEEIDELVDSYNIMAENLKDIYESLENKVADRTKKLKEAYNELKSTQAMMVHSEKMKSLGELVAGITHEINNPINFIYGNLIHLTNYTNDLIMLIDKYGEYEGDLLEEHKKEIEQIKEDIDLAFLKEDLSSLINSCKEGTERTKNIILDLKNFSRMEERVLSSINIAKEIDTTLNILHSKYKNRIEIHKDYQEDLPLVESYGGQLNQVFMNILDNAFYAIEDKGDVYITTRQSGKNVIIEIRDTGKGMDKEVAERIFDPFFTTKPVGQGTGLGMSISYNVIQNHHGDIKIKTTKGKGTTFIIILPITFVKEEKDTNAENEQ